MPLAEAENHGPAAPEVATVQEAGLAEEPKLPLIKITREQLAKPIVVRIPDDKQAPIRIRLTNN